MCSHLRIQGREKGSVWSEGVAKAFSEGGRRLASMRGTRTSCRQLHQLEACHVLGDGLPMPAGSIRARGRSKGGHPSLQRLVIPEVRTHLSVALFPRPPRCLPGSRPWFYRERRYFEGSRSPTAVALKSPRARREGGRARAATSCMRPSPPPRSIHSRQPRAHYMSRIHETQS
eukprot:COSAG02_NODE_163_length_32424_cov_21.759010_3_plen_173_part_00